MRLGRRAPGTAATGEGSPRDAATLGAAVVVVANAFAWVMSLLFSDPARVGADPVRGYLWCVAFAVLASAVSVSALAARGRPVRLVLVVCGLAIWALLPATVFLGVWLALINIFALVFLLTGRAA